MPIIKFPTRVNNAATERHARRQAKALGFLTAGQIAARLGWTRRKETRAFAKEHGIDESDAETVLIWLGIAHRLHERGLLNRFRGLLPERLNRKQRKR
jgi:hypothetical protein